MCGIAGGWSREPRFREAMPRVLARLAHRGPDDRGDEYYDALGGEVAFGHTRLSIIDLSSGGHQPMHTPDGRYSLVYNGEVYNYRELRAELATDQAFRTDSDTEVLLAAWARWGAACLPKLRGMFAFAVFDRERGTLTCVRDAFGIKPFFYAAEDGGFAFASEAPALVELLGGRRDLDLQTAYEYLALGTYDRSARTFHSGVRQLEPSHLLVFDLARGAVIEHRRWWFPPIAERAVRFDDAVAELRERFLTNVRLHLRSDVPVGAALSGGIDSSAVVCAMRAVEPDMPIHTFSFVARGSPRDEERWADVVNSHVGAQAHKVVVSPDELAADLDDMVRAQGEPFGSTSIYAQYRVYKLAREHGITVTLDGQGADELLAGYDGYPEQRVHSLLEAGRPLEALSFMRAWSRGPDRSGGRFKSAAVTAFTPAWAMRMAPRALKARVKSLLGMDSPPTLVDERWLTAHGVTLGWPQDASPRDARRRRLMAMLRDQLVRGSIPALLRHGDRNAMRWSIESRVPFLTTDLAEYVLGLPEAFVLSGDGETKHVFRAAMRGIVPDAILDRKDKIGFETPERVWLAALGPKVGEWLEGLDALPFVDARAARAEVAAMIEGSRPFSWQAWRLINFARWNQLR